MDLRDEARRIRIDFECWRNTGEAIGARIEALEQALRDAAEVPTAASPPPASKIVPPPLPSMAVLESQPPVGVEAPSGLGPVPTFAATSASDPVAAGRSAETAAAHAPAAPHTATPPERKPWPEVDAGPSPWQRLAAFAKRLGPKEEMGWEMALGTYWLPRIAIVVLLIGLVGVLIVAVERFRNAAWAPYGRIALGYASCVVLLVLGRQLELRARAFGRVLLAGGFAMTYFVTFATHFIPLARISTHPAPTLVALAVVVAGWGAVAQARRSYLIALGVTALGHMTAALASVEMAGSIGSVAALLLLSGMSAYFLLRNGWFHVAAAGLVGSHLNYLLWLARSPDGITVLDFTLAMAVAAAFFVLFATAELVSPEGLRRRRVALRWRTLYVSFNTGAFLVLGLLLMRGFPFARGETHFLYWGLSAILLGYGCAYWRMRRGDPIFNTYFAKSMALLTVGLAVYFDGRVLTLSLALQALTLLWFARTLALPVNRVLAFAVAVAAFVHGVYDFDAIGGLSAIERGGWLGALPALLAVAALLGMSVLDARTRWESIPPWLPRAEWIAVPPYLYALFAVLLALGYGNLYAPTQDQAWAFSVGALALAGGGALLRLRPWTATALPLSAAAFLSCVVELFLGPEALPRSDAMPGYAHGVLRVALTMFPFLILSELSRIGLGRNPDAWLRAMRQETHPQREPLPYVYALAGAALYALAVFHLAEPSHRFALLAGGALSLSVYAALLPGLAMGVAGLTLLVPTLAAGLAAHAALLPGALLLFGVALLSERRYLGGRVGLAVHHMRFAPYLLYGLAAYYLGVYINTLLGVPGMAAAAVLAGVAMLVLHPHALAWVAVLYFYWAVAEWTDSWQSAWEWNAYAAGLPLLSIAADRFLVRRLGKRNVQGAVFLALGCFVALSYADDVLSGGWRYTAWPLVGAAYLLYGGFLGGRTACVLGLLAGAAATLGFIEDAQLARMTEAPLWVGLLTLVAFWVLVERAHAIAAAIAALPGSWLRESRRLGALLAVLPCVLAIAMLPRLDVQLTIAWTLAAPLMFGAAILFRQPWYRYAGLATFGLAIARGIVIDTRALDPLSRTLALILLGTVLLAVGYAYTRVRERRGSVAEPTSGEEQIPYDPQGE